MAESLTSPLAEPFAQIFTDRAEADWAFDLLRDTAKRLGIQGAYDPRFAITLARRSGRMGLHLNFGGWLVLGIHGPGQTPARVDLALLASLVSWDERFNFFSFARKEGEPEVRSYHLPLDLIRPMTSDLQTAYLTTLDFIAQKFSTWQRASHWKQHNPEIAEALFKPENREQLFAGSLTEPELRYERHLTAFYQDISEEREEYEVEEWDTERRGGEEAEGREYLFNGRPEMDLNQNEENLLTAISQFRQNPQDRFVVKLRRKRAEQIREILSNPDAVDLNTFNHEIWVVQNGIFLRGKNISAVIDPSSKNTFNLDQITEMDQALDAGELEIHGNCIWGSASRVYAPMLKDDNQKIEYIRQAINILNSSNLAPIQKTQQINQIYGFGNNISTGLVMMYHPKEFGLYNEQGKQILRNLGYGTIKNLNSYQETLQHLREKLAVDDFIELDWFLYLINQGKYNINQPRTHVIRERGSGLFTQRTFELLAGLHDSPTKDFYTSKKNDFRAYVEEPFQHLFQRVAAQLPPPITNLMETKKQVFAKILKNDYGQGGTWDFYWGAFYRKEGKRTENAQLFIWINQDRLEFGFYVGVHGNTERKRFLHNIQTNYNSLLPILQQYLVDNSIVYGSREDYVLGKAVPSLEEWLKDVGEADIRAAIILHRDKVLEYSAEQLANLITHTFIKFFPLILIAITDDPLPAINNFLTLSPPDNETPTEAASSFILHPSSLPYPLPQLAADTALDETELARWVRAIERKGQAILYGPPGTGKTFVAEKLARHLIGGGDGFWELVQFHPAYAYEDFIQGIRPESQGDFLTYPLKPGRFLEFCEQVQGRQDTCVLIIDEINRANLSRVFGELMYLLEYRERAIPLAGGGAFRIPANVRLIGTMNTADRSIALVDHALRRRFAFIALYPNFDLLRRYHQQYQTGFPVEKLVSLLQKLNHTIADRHYEVGVTFFLRPTLADEIEDIWRMEIEPYLEEYFFDRTDTVEEFRWEKIKSQIVTG